MQFLRLREQKLGGMNKNASYITRIKAIEEFHLVKLINIYVLRIVLTKRSKNKKRAVTPSSLIFILVNCSK